MANDATDEAPDGLDEGAARREARRRLARRSVFVAMAVVLAASAVSLPFIVVSLFEGFAHPVTNLNERVTPAASLGADSLEANLEAVALSETAGTVTFRVTGERRCATTCAKTERLAFFAIRGNPNGAEGGPPGAVVDIPATTSDFDATAVLPVTGDLIDYPFDEYHLTLGVEVGYLSRNGGDVAITGRADRHLVALSLGEELPRIRLESPTVLPASRYSPDYASVDAMTFRRPLYLQLLTVLLVLAITVAATYAIVLRPFDQIIPTIGGIVLGVWGVRSLLVGSYPADSTAVDLILTLVIALLLLLVMGRGLTYLWRRLQHGPEATPP